MQLEHSFSVPVGIDEAWRILIDIERIGPCMPGAAIDTVDGDDFTGTVKVKLGPINLTYKGKAAFVEKDAEARRAVIDARGRDARGNGTAAAKITATLHEEGGITLVKVITDLDITGKPAQFGRGVMVDVGNKLLGQFADSLARTIEGPGAAEVAEAPSAAAAQTAAAAQSAGSPDAAAEPPAEDATAEPLVAAEAEAAPKRTRPKPPTKATTRTAAKRAPAGAGTAAAAAAGETAAAVGQSAVPAPEAAPVPAETEAAGTSEVADQEASAPAEAEESAAAEGAAEAAAGATSALNGRSPLSARSHDDIEPIDLLHHAGPAVAKRVGPVLLALVVLIVAIRRLRKTD